MENHTITIPARDQHGRVDPVEVVKLLAKMENGGLGDESWRFAEAFINEHPTLQQKMMATLLTAVVAMAELADAKRTDDRNDASGWISQKIRDLLEEKGFTFGPHPATKPVLGHSLYSGRQIKFPFI